MPALSFARNRSAGLRRLLRFHLPEVRDSVGARGRIGDWVGALQELQTRTWGSGADLGIRRGRGRPPVVPLSSAVGSDKLGMIADWTKDEKRTGTQASCLVAGDS